MMDPYNLAICFGPTLVPIPTDRDQVQFQNLVNELIKNFIIFHEDIFPTDGSGAVYEKYISSEPDDVQEYGNEETALNGDDLDSEVTEDGKRLFFGDGLKMKSALNSYISYSFVLIYIVLHVFIYLLDSWHMTGMGLNLKLISI